MTKQCLFQGLHNLKQLEKIVEIMGYPQSEEDTAFISD
jgi:hypothetical protein